MAKSATADAGLGPASKAEQTAAENALGSAAEVAEAKRMMKTRAQQTEAALAKQPKESVYIERERWQGRAGGETLRIAINGFVQHIPLGQRVEVPQAVAAVLRNAGIIEDSA